MKKSAPLLSSGSPAQHDQRAGYDGQDRHDQGKTLKVQMEQGDQSGHDEPDAQQDHSQILCQPAPTHFVILLFFVSHIEYWP
ncbi:MAG: hypothetical protein PHX05_05050, partial [Acidobacteriota bacterium]|nr:hypothetical protein [Acidobacteriota bacterium]